MFAFHPEVAALFRAGGWSPERRTDLAVWEQKLRAQGFELFGAAERVLACVGGLTVRGPARAETRGCAREIVFDPLAGGDGKRERFKEWEQLVGQRLYPLADLGPRLSLMVAEDGAVFAGQMCLFYRYGGTFEEAMAMYFLGAGAKPIQCSWCD